MDTKFLEQFYEKVILPQYASTVFNNVTWIDHGAIELDSFAHYFKVDNSGEYVPIIRGTSSMGRLGLFVHITADLIDLGSINQYTLMLYAVQGLRVYPGMKVGQVTFWEITGEKTLYEGKYQGSIGPAESKVYKDFE